MGSAMSWLTIGPGFNATDGKIHEKAIPYQLADTKKYDVWIMNARGNKFGREHMWLDPDTEKDFWNFSFEEFGDFDLKASMQKIIETKNDN